MTTTDSLIQSAIEYGQAVAAVDSATGCNMPDLLIYRLSQNVIAAEEQLLYAATAIYEDKLDGAAA